MPRKHHSDTPPMVAAVHRFRDKVACYAASPENGTLYLTSKDARRYAAAILAAADSIDSESFINSSVPQFVLTTADKES